MRTLLGVRGGVAVMIRVYTVCRPLDSGVAAPVFSFSKYPFPRPCLSSNRALKPFVL